MGYDRSDSFPFDFERNGITFGSKSKGKLSLRSYPIQCERKWKHSFLSAAGKWFQYLFTQRANGFQSNLTKYACINNFSLVLKST